MKEPTAGNVLEALQNAVKSLYTDAGIDPQRDVAGIGIGIAGLLDRKKRHCASFAKPAFC